MKKTRPSRIQVTSRFFRLGLNWVFYCLALSTASAQPYLFTTLAGDLGFGSGSADGTNSGARFYFPAGIATDNAGTFYIGDHGWPVKTRIIVC